MLSRVGRPQRPRAEVGWTSRVEPHRAHSRVGGVRPDPPTWRHPLPRFLRRLLTAGGVLVQPDRNGNRWLGPIGCTVSGALLNLVSKQRIGSFVAKLDTQALEELRDLIEADQMKPVVDSAYPLERAADTVALVKDGRPAGKVVVTVPA